MFDFDACVIGAGAVGLATARALSIRGKSVVVLERHAGFGEETSSRNSEVIHAGLYYPPGSLKARLCVEGKRALYRYGAERGFRAEAIGKLIVATSPAEVTALEGLMARGAQNDVTDLTVLTPSEVRAMEPALECLGAIHSPSSGLLDSHLYMLALLGDIEAAGGALARMQAFEGADPQAEGFGVRAGGAGFTVRWLINAAGLSADKVSNTIEGLEKAQIPIVRYAKGSYFRYATRQPFSRLVYPAPNPAGHGVHFTPMPDGRGRFGPDVEMCPTLDYTVDSARAKSFAEGIKTYWPAVREELLLPDYAGIRPKIGRAPAAFEDFRIETASAHGLEGLICLYGIDSPGLTASFALGEHVAALCQ